ncbi:MAG: DUF6786 family protein [Thermoguttaceae bacterium]
MSYSNGLFYLESKTKVYELSNEFGARVAVCPDWNGRIMTSTCSGIDGESSGLIDVHNIDEISKHQHTSFIHPPQTNTIGREKYIGGENQFVIEPENGPFGILERVDDPSDETPHTIHNAYKEGPFDVDTGINHKEIRLRRIVKFSNRIGTPFALSTVRTIRLLDIEELSERFASPIVVAMEQPDISYISYETNSTIVNIGEPLTRDGGLVSVKIRNMFNASPYSVLLVPFRRGDEDMFGPPINADFFGATSRQRLQILPSVAVLKLEGLLHANLSVSNQRVVSRCAAIDFRSGLFTIISFNLPDVPALCKYTDAENVMTAYKHEPTPSDTETSFSSPYYGFDTCTPAKELRHGESVTHSQLTTHIYADNKTLEYLVQTIFHVDVNKVFNTVY